MFLIIQSEFLYRGLNVVHPVIYFPREKMSPTYPLLSISSNPPLSLTLLNSSPFWINGYLPYEILDGKSIIPYKYTCRVEFMFINTSKRSSNVPIFVCGVYLIQVIVMDTSETFWWYLVDRSLDTQSRHGCARVSPPRDIFVLGWLFFVTVVRGTVVFLKISRRSLSCVKRLNLSNLT